LDYGLANIGIAVNSALILMQRTCEWYSR